MNGCLIALLVLLSVVTALDPAFWRQTPSGVMNVYMVYMYLHTLLGSWMSICTFIRLSHDACKAGNAEVFEKDRLWVCVYRFSYMTGLNVSVLQTYTEFSPSELRKLPTFLPCSFYPTCLSGRKGVRICKASKMVSLAPASCRLALMSQQIILLALCWQQGIQKGFDLLGLIVHYK